MSYIRFGKEYDKFIIISTLIEERKIGKGDTYRLCYIQVDRSLSLSWLEISLADNYFTNVLHFSISPGLKFC